MTIVTAVEELTPEWFTRALADDESTVTDVRLAPMDLGAMCRMVRASLTWSTGAVGGPDSVIVKFPTADANTLGLARAMRMYDLEVCFYRDLLPLLGDVNVPACHV